MKTIILTVAVSVLSLAVATQSQAGPHANKISHAHVNVQQQHNKVVNTAFNKTNANKVVNYHLQHGTKFAQGYLYKGKHHTHWSFIRFDSRYGCNIYFDPCLLVWFYWCEPDFCYYPISFCPYRTYCRFTTVVVQPVVPVVPVCNTCNTVLPAGIQVQTMAPPISNAPAANIAPSIPEPLSPIMNP